MSSLIRTYFAILPQALQNKWQIVGIDVVEHGLYQGNVRRCRPVGNVGRRRHLHERQAAGLLVAVVQHIGGEDFVASRRQPGGEVAAAATVVQHSFSRKQLLQLLKISFRLGLRLVVVINRD